MRSIRRLVLGLRLSLTLGALGACGGASTQDCDDGCRNYYTLAFWSTAGKEIDKAPPAERDALRKAKAADLEKRMLDGLPMCTSQCRTAGSPSVMKCVAKARTFAEAKDCGDINPE